MGAEGIVAIAANKAADEVKKQLAEAIRPHIDIYKTAALGYVDDVIDPPRDAAPARALAAADRAQAGCAALAQAGDRADVAWR